MVAMRASANSTNRYVDHIATTQFSEQMRDVSARSNFPPPNIGQLPGMPPDTLIEILIWTFPLPECFRTAHSTAWCGEREISQEACHNFVSLSASLWRMERGSGASSPRNRERTWTC